MRSFGAMAAGGAGVAAVLGVALAYGAEKHVDLKQNWDVEKVSRWYGGYQGSRLVPESWLRALEQPDGQGLFLDPVHIAGFRYLTDGVSDLPVGFAIDRQDDRDLGATKLRWKANQPKDEPWVGLTCSACHTNELRYGETVMRVQGGPTLGDFQGLLVAFNSALAQTSTDPAKFQRFGDRVLGAAATAADRQRLKGELQKLIQYQDSLAKLNKTDLSYGFGRLDAVGHILNKVAYVASPTGAAANPSDAPVSYPFLWNISQQTRVQWNGFVSNDPKTFPSGQTIDYLGLGRNVGEVVGVFADVNMQPGGLLGVKAKSSVQVRNLIAIEQQLTSLKPPLWPRDVMPVDAALAARGKAVFAAQNCGGCHAPLARDDLKTRERPDGKPLETMTPIFPIGDPGAIGADPRMACNLVIRETATGILNGKRVAPGAGAKFGPKATNGQMVDATVKYVLADKAGAIAASTALAMLGLHPPVQVSPAVGAVPLDPEAARLEACRKAGLDPKVAAVLAYKGRPLTGVWATGPFLHNGSAPTLYDLFLPPDQRLATFLVGTREFDPARVGFVTTPRPDNTFLFRARDAQGQPIPGNSNLGHDYNNAGLAEADRWALVEYMKVIGEPEAP